MTDASPPAAPSPQNPPLLPLAPPPPPPGDPGTAVRDAWIPEQTGSTPSREADPSPARRRPYKAPSRPFRALVLVVGGLLTAFVLTVAALAFADTLGRTTDSATVTFPAGIRKVVIDVDHGTIDVRGTDRPDVRGERRVTRGLQSPAYDETVAGDTLTIESACPVIVSVWCEVGYTLDVPADVELDLTDGAGRVEARGVTGRAQIRSGAGSVRVDDMTGNLDLRSGAGSVSGTRLRSSLVSALSGAGSVTLEFVTPPEGVKAEAGAGSVDIEVPRDGATYRIESSHGGSNTSVAVPTDPASPRVIAAKSGAGTVRVHQPAR